MYIALIHPIESVVNNKKIWKMKILQRFSHGTFIEGVIITNGNISKYNWQRTKIACLFSAG